MSMQRRIFLVHGKPFTLVRDGFIETHGTLAKLIEKHRSAESDWSDDPETAPTPAQAVAPDIESSVAIRDEAVAAAQREGQNAPLAKPRKARTQKPKPPSASAKTAIVAAATAEAPKTEETAAGIEAAPIHASRMRVVGRRAGQPPTPRWKNAGKERRGRLK